MPKMLLVEDDRSTALAYEALLSMDRADLTVKTVWSAEAALLCLAKTNYDVIVSDFKLPGLDGLGLLIATYCLHSAIPFVLVSAYGDRVLEDTAARLGAYAVLHKPIAPEALLDVVNRALTQGREAVDRRKGVLRSADAERMPRVLWPAADAESNPRD